jgi:hypothetical protein
MKMGTTMKKIIALLVAFVGVFFYGIALGAPAEDSNVKVVTSLSNRVADNEGVRATNITLTYILGSSMKLQQITGDCDWAQWDATIADRRPICNLTISQTALKADVLGAPLGASFEHDGKLIFLFADTIGATIGNGDENAYYPTWVSFFNLFKWNAGDPIAWSYTRRAEDGLAVNFFLDGDHALPVQPPQQPDGEIVDMGPDDFPGAGISLDGKIYIVCMTGTVSSAENSGVGADYSNDRSVLIGFDERDQRFSSGRTISKVANGGHFVYTGLHEATPELLENPSVDFTEPMVLMFGVGTYWNSNVYLSIIPKSEFWSGVDQNGNSGTRYFKGLDVYGRPSWSERESDANPVVVDLDPSKPTIGNFSVNYSPELGLWLMTFSGGLHSRPTAGVYFTYATKPWGPWSKPQLIFNDCRDHGLGNFIRYYYETSPDNFCPSAMPSGPNPAPNGAGPTGPTIGPQTSNDPFTTLGSGFSPQMIERFTEIEGDTLKIFYNISTWNPYAVVLMESDFMISHLPN